MAFSPRDRDIPSEPGPTSNGWVVVTFIAPGDDAALEPEDAGAVYGPFEDQESALVWAEHNTQGAFVARTLHPPEGLSTDRSDERRVSAPARR